MGQKIKNRSTDQKNGSTEETLDIIVSEYQMHLITSKSYPNTI